MCAHVYFQYIFILINSLPLIVTFVLLKSVLFFVIIYVMQTSAESGDTWHRTRTAFIGGSYKIDPSQLKFPFLMNKRRHK